MDHDAARDIINFLRSYDGVVTQTDIPGDQVRVSGSVSRQAFVQSLAMQG